MTIPRFNAIARDWSKCPPLYLCVAVANGIKVDTTGSGTKPQTNEEKVTELLSLFPVVGK